MHICILPTEFYNTKIITHSKVKKKKKRKRIRRKEKICIMNFLLRRAVELR